MMKTPHLALLGSLAMGFGAAQAQTTAPATTTPSTGLTDTRTPGDRTSLVEASAMEAGANSFTVSLSRAPGLIEQIIKATEKEAIADIDSGWTVTSPEPRGLAVVWYPTPEIGLRSIAAEQVARSRCTATPAPQN